jgi:uncharacterized protein (TIGR02646 family)
MVQLPNLPLTAVVADKLTEWQQGIDDEADYAQRVALAKSRFSQRNRRGNATFDAVKVVLTAICTGPRRCAYCEDSVADEVEHMRPKDLYPEAVFLWANYVYACGPCNGPKNNKFAVLRGRPLRCEEVSRADDAPIVPPPAGAPALIDPRAEDPLYFLFLDLGNTFTFTIADDLSRREELRADYTLRILGLNTRDYLVQSRRNAFGGYLARLEQYLQRKNAGHTDAQLQLLIDDLIRSHHRTVWKEMQRQHTLYPPLTQLFAAAPEALTW